MGESVRVKTEKEVALEVIEGKWGVDDDRVVRLTNAGYNASSVQKVVNNMLKNAIVADEPKVANEQKQIMEVDLDLKKYGALIINFVE